MKRALLIVLDSVGAGAMPDAARYGDEGANTLLHVMGNTPDSLTNLRRLGLGHLPEAGLNPHPEAAGAFGRMAEASPGKDTTTGHWEIAGLRLENAFPTFPNGFPESLIKAFERAIGRRTLGNRPASGTVIIEELGEEHLRTGFPIVYTSADSVFQLAAHEAVIAPEVLYEMCSAARSLLVGDWAVGRVIARPFEGTGKGAFRRTERRKDFSLEPVGETVLDALKLRGLDVYGVGKIGDIFAGRGLTGSEPATGNSACLDVTLRYMRRPFHGLCFVNLVDFDMLYGHRRDADGYARALDAFDHRLPEITDSLRKGDLLIITADHGCDPTHPGTDHTREYVPLLAWRPGMSLRSALGDRSTFADVAATLAEFFGLPERFGATSFLKETEECLSWE